MDNYVFAIGSGNANDLASQAGVLADTYANIRAGKSAVAPFGAQPAANSLLDTADNYVFQFTNNQSVVNVSGGAPGGPWNFYLVNPSNLTDKVLLYSLAGANYDFT
jgi:hypothetical protein